MSIDRQHDTGSRDNNGLTTLLWRFMRIDPSRIAYIPPEGSTETNPPYESPEIRYWRVIDGRREYRHRSAFAAPRCPQARGRIYRATADMLRSRARRLLAALLVLAAIFFLAPLPIYLWPEMVEAAFNRGALALLIAFFSLMFAIYWKVYKAMTASSRRSDLSYDEEPWLRLSVLLLGGIGSGVFMALCGTAGCNLFYLLMGAPS